MTTRTDHSKEVRDEERVQGHGQRSPHDGARRLWGRYLDEPFKKFAPKFGQMLMHDDLDPRVADALARAHNNWTHDSCRHDPTLAIGDDSIVVSTDYAHSDGLLLEAINEFVGLEGVSDKTKVKILWDNFARLHPLAAT